MGPLYRFGWFDFAYSLQLACLLGFCFGFVLERAGFGNARKLAAIFYLRDFAVLKVMFTAIVVCMLGLLYFSVFGWIDYGRVFILPTYLWPQILGGFVLGVGFIMGGYCPTTSVVATVSGKLDGLVFITGMVLGSFIFGELFPVFQGIYSAGHMGSVRLPDILGIHSGFIALLVCFMAVGAFWFAEIMEKKFGDPDSLPTASPNAKRTAAAALVLLGLILAIVNPDQIAAKRTSAPLAPPENMEAPGDVIPESKKSPDTFVIKEDEGC